MDEVKVGNAVSKVDRRTKEYRDSQKTELEGGGMASEEGSSEVDYDLCNDPHGIGCRRPLPPLDSGGKRTSIMSEPCRECVFRNF